MIPRINDVVSLDGEKSKAIALVEVGLLGGVLGISCEYHKLLIPHLS